MSRMWQIRTWQTRVWQSQVWQRRGWQSRTCRTLCCLTMAVTLFGCNKQESTAPTPIPFVATSYTPTPPPLGAIPGEGVNGMGDHASSAQTPTVNYWTPTSNQSHQALNEYGSWTSSPQYGQVWRPQNISADWRPYTQGQWLYTDQSWLWQSSEPWGWLPYHYGRWVFLPVIGWSWVPGTEWVPASVVWRHSDAYVAWAPAPPRGIAINTIPAAAWVMVPSSRLLQTRLAPHILPPAAVRPLLGSTRVIVDTRPYGNTLLYRGPNVTLVKRWGGILPARVNVHAWRNAVPTRYKHHFDQGRQVGWYGRTSAPPPPRATSSSKTHSSRTTTSPPRRPARVETRRERRRSEIDTRRDRRPRNNRDRPNRTVEGNH